MLACILTCIYPSIVVRCACVSELDNYATCSVLIQTNIANKHMQISEPLSSQTVLGWIHFSSTVFGSSQPSRAERNVWTSWRLHFTIPFLFQNLYILFHTAFTGGKYFGALNVIWTSSHFMFHSPQDARNHLNVIWTSSHFMFHSSQDARNHRRIIRTVRRVVCAHFGSCRTYCNLPAHIASHSHTSLSLCILASLSLSLTHKHYLSFLFHTAFWFELFFFSSTYGGTISCP